MTPLNAARAFLEECFPECLAGFLAGSVVRGEAISTSDLDIVVITERPDAPYRESFVRFGWPIEAFVHTSTSRRQFFASDARRRRPSLANMCAEGIILKDTNDVATSIQQEANDHLQAGPPPLTATELAWSRYQLTDLLDDFLGSSTHHEAVFVATDLINATMDLIFDTRCMWRGKGKWNYRKLMLLDASLAWAFQGALEAFYLRQDRGPLVALVEGALESVGGRLFEGFTAGKL